MGFCEDELVVIKYRIKVFSTVFFCLHLFTLILCGFTFYETFYRQPSCISQPPQHKSSSKESVTQSNIIDDTVSIDLSCSGISILLSHHTVQNTVKERTLDKSQRKASTNNYTDNLKICWPP